MKKLLKVAKLQCHKNNLGILGGWKQQQKLSIGNLLFEFLTSGLEYMTLKLRFVWTSVSFKPGILKYLLCW